AAADPAVVDLDEDVLGPEVGHRVLGDLEDPRRPVDRRGHGGRDGRCGGLVSHRPRRYRTAVRRAASAPAGARRAGGYAPRVLDVVVTAVVVSGFVLLGVAAARHGRWHDDFVAQLRAQRLWPREVEATVAWVVTGAEAVVGALGVLLLAFGVGAVALTPLLGGLVVLGVGFVGLQVFLLVARPEATCGCDPAHDTRVGVGTLGKAAWPAVAGVVGLVALPAE